jgi:membrane protein DedA with SNARE-associated domain
LEDEDEIPVSMVPPPPSAGLARAGIAVFASFINSFLHSYGYFAVALLVGLECVGIPLPGESTLIAAALYAGTTHRLNIIVIAIVAASAAIIGDNIGYAVGHFGGVPLMKRYGRYVHLTEGRQAVGRYLFRRHGGKVVFAGRFIAILRTYAAFLSGVNRMPWHRFVIYNAAGGILWAAIYSFGAFALGNAATGIGSIITYIGLGLTVVLTVGITWLTRRSFARLESRALAEESTSEFLAHEREQDQHQRANA